MERYMARFTFLEVIGEEKIKKELFREK